MLFPKNLVFRNAKGTLAELRAFLADPANEDQKIKPAELFVLHDEERPILLTYIPTLEDVGGPYGTLPQVAWARNSKWSYTENSGIIFQTATDGGPGFWDVQEPFPYNLTNSTLNEFYDTTALGEPDSGVRQIGDTLVWRGDELNYNSSEQHEGYFELTKGFGYPDLVGDNGIIIPGFQGNFGWDDFLDAEIVEPIEERSGIYWDQIALQWTNRYYEQSLANRSDVNLDEENLKTLDALTYFSATDSWGVKPLSEEGVLAIPDGRRGRDPKFEYVVVSGRNGVQIDTGVGFWEGDFYGETTEFHPLGTRWYVPGNTLTGTEIRDEFSPGGGWSRFPDGAWYISTFARYTPPGEFIDGCLRWNLMADKAEEEVDQVDYQTMLMPITKAGEGTYGEDRSGYFNDETYYGNWTMQFWMRIDTDSRVYEDVTTGLPQPLTVFRCENLRIAGSTYTNTANGYIIDLQATSTGGDHTLIRDVQENTDYHIAIVNNAQSRTSRAYVNGQLVSIQDQMGDGQQWQLMRIGPDFQGYIADFVITLCDEYVADNDTGYLDTFAPPVGWGRRKVQAPRAAVKTLGVSDKGRFAWVGSENPLVWNTAEAKNQNKLEAQSNLPIDFLSGLGGRALSWDEDKEQFVQRDYSVGGTFYPVIGGPGTPIRTLEEMQERHDLVVSEDLVKDGARPSVFIYNPKYQPAGLGSNSGALFGYRWDYDDAGFAKARGVVFASQESDVQKLDGDDDRLWRTGLPQVVRNERYPEGAWYHSMKLIKIFSFFTWFPTYLRELQPWIGAAGSTKSYPYPGQLVAVRFGYDYFVGQDIQGSGRDELIDTSWCNIGLKGDTVYVYISLRNPYNEETQQYECWPDGATQEERDAILANGLSFCNNVTIELKPDLSDTENKYEIAVLYDINTGIHIFWNGQRFPIVGDPYDDPSDPAYPTSLPQYLQAPGRWSNNTISGITMSRGCYLEKVAVMNRLPEGWRADLGEFDFSSVYDLEEQLPGLKLEHGLDRSFRSNFLYRSEYAFSGTNEVTPFNQYKAAINLDKIGPGYREARTLFDTGSFSGIREDESEWRNTFYMGRVGGGRYSQVEQLSPRSYYGQPPNNSTRWYISRYSGAAIPNFAQDVISFRAANEEGHVLTWSADAQKWVSKAQPEILSWEINEAEDLSPNNDDIMRWDDTYKEWYATQGKQDVLLSLDDLTDVSIEDPASNNYLRYSATKDVWENRSIEEIGYLENLADVQYKIFEGKDRLQFSSTINRWEPVAPFDYTSVPLSYLDDVQYHEDPLDTDNPDLEAYLIYEGGRWIARRRNFSEPQYFRGIYETYRWEYFGAGRSLGNAFVIDNPPVTRLGEVDPITGEFLPQQGDVQEGYYTNWVDAPGPAVTASGDGGNFEYAEVEAGFPMQFYGGGNLELGEEDVPVEWLAGMESGEFTEVQDAPPQIQHDGVIVAALPFSRFRSSSNDEEEREANTQTSLDGRSWEIDPVRLIDRPSFSNAYMPDSLKDKDNSTPPGATSDGGVYFDNSAPNLGGDGRDMRYGLFTDETEETEITDQDFTLDIVFNYGVDYTSNQTRKTPPYFLAGASSEVNISKPGEGLQWELRISRQGIDREIDDAFSSTTAVAEDDIVFFNFKDEDGNKHEIVVNWGPNGFNHGTKWEDYYYPSERRDDYEWTFLSVQRNYNRQSFIFYCNGRRQEVFTPLARIPFRSIAEENGARLGIGCTPTPNIAEYTGFNGFVSSFRIVKGECLRGKGSEEQALGNYAMVYETASAN